MDLNAGTLGDEQTAWLKADLAAVDRKNTPWVIATSHFPLYNDAVAKASSASASYYVGDEGEHYASSGHKFVPAKCDADGKCEKTVGELMGSIQSELMPILHQYNVDVWNVSHQPCVLPECAYAGWSHPRLPINLASVL